MGINLVALASRVAIVLAYGAISTCILRLLQRLNQYGVRRSRSLWIHVMALGLLTLPGMLHLLTRTGEWWESLYAAIAVCEAIALVVFTHQMSKTLLEGLKAQRLLRPFLDNASVGMMAFDSVLDRRGRIVDFCCVLENQYSLAKGPGKPMVGKLLLEEMPYHMESGLFDQYCRSAQGETLSKEFHYPGLGWYQNRSFPLPGGFGVTYSNISELKEAALRDSLTGLYNRRFLDDPPPFRACLHLDLDNFKQVNDFQGHPVGDELLKAVAARLKGCIRPGDHLVRLGGDEFLALLDLPTDQDMGDIALSTAQRFTHELSKPYEVNELSLEVGVSIGVYVCQPGDELERAITAADIALNIRKRERVKYPPELLYTPEMGNQERKQHGMEVDLKRAIRQGELVLHYQRVVALTDPKYPTVGFEALVRWQHPTRGLLSAAEFIPAAERSGAIGAITDFVFGEAYRQACQWTRFDRPLKMGVNLAAHDLNRPQFLAAIKQMLAQGPLAPGILTLELTESAFIDVAQSTIQQTASQLQEWGAQWAIDDAGTGYNGLMVIQELGHLFDTLKIDRSFVSGPNASLALCDAFCAIARHFSMEVVAEGIESQEQADALAALGIKFGQGFFFEDGMPMPPDECEKLLLQEWQRV
jgi:diguanylate cyclase (GGDEF)-like protein